jgi:hypothetical protein
MTGLGVRCLLLLVLAGQGFGSVSAQESDRMADAAVREAVDRVMTSHDFRHLAPGARSDEKGALARLLEWLFGNEEEEGKSGVRVSAGSGLAEFFLVLLYFLAATVIALVIFFIVRGLAARGERRAGTAAGRVAPAAAELVPAAPPGEQPAQAYLERALALARAGEYRAAIAQLLLGGMSWLERAGAIRFRKGLTNRDYLRAARGHPGFRTGLSTIVGHFEETHFGRRAASPERFEACLDHFRRSVSDARTE